MSRVGYLESISIGLAQKLQGYSLQRTEGSRRADGRIWVGESLSHPLFFISGCSSSFSEDSEEVSRGRGVLWGTGLSASAGFPRPTWAEPAVMSITRDDVSEMQQETQERGMELWLDGVRAMSMYYGMEWVPHNELNIASNVKSLAAPNWTMTLMIIQII